jgi:hypothetical protein
MSNARTKRVVENRKKIGRRWHGLKGKALTRFVDDDPDVEFAQFQERVRAGLATRSRRGITSPFLKTS